MKKHYISAMEKIVPSDKWRTDTLAAMKNAAEKQKSKSHKQAWLMVAACVAFVLLIPASMSLFNGFNDNLKSSNDENKSGAMPHDVSLGSAPEVAMYDAGNAKNRSVLIAEDKADSVQSAIDMAVIGHAYLEKSQEPGGYNPDEFTVIDCELVIITNNEDNSNENVEYYKITVKDKLDNVSILTDRPIG